MPHGLRHDATGTVLSAETACRSVHNRDVVPHFFREQRPLRPQIHNPLPLFLEPGQLFLFDTGVTEILAPSPPRPRPPHTRFRSGWKVVLVPKFWPLRAECGVGPKKFSRAKKILRIRARRVAGTRAKILDLRCKIAEKLRSAEQSGVRGVGVGGGPEFR